MLISIAMIAMGYQVLKNSALSLIKGEPYFFSFWLIFVCFLTILIKLFLYIYTHQLNKKYQNLLLEANSKDHRNDCILTCLNLLACLFSLQGIYFLDGVVGILFALWIFFSALKIFKESYDVLMDKSMKSDAIEKVLNLVSSHKEVLRVNHFNATPVGYQYQISFTIFVDGSLSTFESHEIANHLEKEIAKEIPEVYLTVIHVNPQKVEDSSSK